MGTDNPWKKYQYALDSFESDLKRLSFEGIFQRPSSPPDRTYSFPFDVPTGALAVSQVEHVLSAIEAPHGFDLLNPVEPPPVPQVPARPQEPPPEWDRYTEPRVTRLTAKAEEIRSNFRRRHEREVKLAVALYQGCTARNVNCLEKLVELSLERHYMPVPLYRDSTAKIDEGARVVLVTIEVPDFSRLPVVKKRGNSWTAKWQSVSATEKPKLNEKLLYSLCLRAAYLAAMSDVADAFDTVAVNARQQWFSPATGAEEEGIIASFQATKTEMRSLNLKNVDVKSCFRHLKGVATPSTTNVAKVRPIFTMDTSDSRIVEAKDVMAEAERETNLAAMEWEDFEHLVGQLFEFEFGRNGVEVKITRASRDRGVDAIMFDPDPFRGGKFVIQAKRYTRPVDVAAVRDLYGTVMNEGANRGILVTTSSYGPDSYEFAKNKPLSLIDGQNLIALLRKHNRNYRINLAEARAQNAVTQDET
jgi:restriction system protein